MLVEKFGSEVVSRKDNRSTSAVFFAAQQGENYASFLVWDMHFIIFCMPHPLEWDLLKVT